MLIYQLTNDKYRWGLENLIAQLSYKDEVILNGRQQGASLD